MLPISNIIDIDVSSAPVGLGTRNVANLAIFTSETPANAGFDTYGVYVSPSQVLEDWGADSECYALAQAIFSQQPNILAAGGVLYIIALQEAETIDDAITRTKDTIYYCGVLTTEAILSTDMAALATAIQAFGDKVLYLTSTDNTLLTTTFLAIKTAGNSRTRCLLYYSTDAADARAFAARYASKLHSVNYTGSRTAITMNVKQLTGQDPDESITQTMYNNAATAGVDLYVSIGGVPGVVSNGANRFADEVLNEIWFVNALEVAAFNALVQVNTKINQTEAGMSSLKGIYRQVCEQAVRNGYVAPGSWTSSEWFGNQEDFINNIRERGYYIYSSPVALQATADRDARKAPLTQIAIKQAGAVHSTIINIWTNR